MNKKVCLNCVALALLVLSMVGCFLTPVKDEITASNTELTLAMLYDFETSLGPDFKSNQIEAQRVTYAKVDGSSNAALRIQFKSKNNAYSGFSFRPERPWDWSGFDSFNLRMDLANAGAESVQVYLSVKDGLNNVATRSVVVPVGGFKTYYAKLAGHDVSRISGGGGNIISGLRSNPPTWRGAETQFIWMWGAKQLDVSQVSEISIAVYGAVSDKTVTIDNLRIAANPEFDKDFLVSIVDEFGQNAKADYPGKIDSLEDLYRARDSELAALKGEVLPGRSKFSGWLAGPKLNGTGYFRTEKVDGQWTLIDPEGYLYFATGLDIIRLSNSSTMTGYDYDQKKIAQRAGDEFTPEDSIGMPDVPEPAKASRHVASTMRANMFSWLPDLNDELANHYSYRRSAHSGPLSRGETFSFYQANLERKYGEIYTNSFLDQWQEVTLKRMLDWGFTSLGNWTDPRFYQNQKIPFFANGWIIGDFKTVSSGNDYWGALPDVFDPVFAERADATAKQIAAEVKGSPWCVGVFIDNEMSFGRPESDQLLYGIVINTLGRDAQAVPTKFEFSRLMKSKYSTIDALNKAWNSQLDSWGDFDQGFVSKDITPLQREDYSLLLSTYANQYFSVVSQAVKKYLPNHLYLGSRLPDWGMPMEVVRAAAKYADVVSYNVYKEGISENSWAFLAEIDKPSIIGEFHMGATDRGLFHPGLIHAVDQADRARMYLRYMDTVIDNPYFVGAHWFQYMDSPLTGRAYDGENYNVGFVDVTDTPYQEMVDAAKLLGKELYIKRFSGASSNN